VYTEFKAAKRTGSTTGGFVDAPSLLAGNRFSGHCEDGEA
jgi:hypothetical protein